LSDRDSDDDDEPAEDESEILNDLTVEKMAGYQWLTNGCEYIGPVRASSEGD
jgi:hypothetical protein